MDGINRYAVYRMLMGENNSAKKTMEASTLGCFFGEKQNSGMATAGKCLWLLLGQGIVFLMA